jgi:hypothetical protein
MAHVILCFMLMMLIFQDESTQTIKKNLAALLLNRKLTDLVVSAERIQYIFIRGKLNTGQLHKMCGEVQ